MSNLTKRDRQAISFSYQSLDSEQREIVLQKTGEIRERLKRSAQDIWEIGQRLADVRSQLKYGQFEAWLKVEFGWSRRTAYNFISVYETFQESANFAQIDIATSALYLLAAPSTSQTIRNEMLERARKGEKITYKELHEAIQSEKGSEDDASSDAYEAVSPVTGSSPPKAQETDRTPPNPKSRAPEIVAIVSKTSTQPDGLINQNLIRHNVEAIALQPGPSAVHDQLHPGWYRLGSQHFLFCGDTASPEFFAPIPGASLALAITSDDWDHDWIVEKADSAIILRESALEEISVKNIILTFSQKGDVVIFPWLPDAEMISVAHNLNRKVFAGDLSPVRCAKAVASARLDVLSVKF